MYASDQAPRLDALSAGHFLRPLQVPAVIPESQEEAKFDPLAAWIWSTYQVVGVTAMNLLCGVPMLSRHVPRFGCRNASKPRRRLWPTDAARSRHGSGGVVWKGGQIKGFVTTHLVEMGETIGELIRKKKHNRHNCENIVWGYIF